MKIWSVSRFSVEVPEIYQIEITNQCQLSCPGCIREDPRVKRPIGFMDPKLVKVMADRGDFNGSYFTELQMYGEPLLSPYLGEIIDTLHGQGLKVGLSTNGTLIGKCHDVLTELDYITVSIDSPIQDEYERMRPGSCYDDLLENINWLVKETKVKVDLQTINFGTQSLTHLIGLAEVMGWDQCDVVCREVPDCSMAYHGDIGPTDELCLNPYMSVSVQWDGDVVPCCLTGDTLVMTRTGPKPIKNIVVGEQVLTHRGRFQMVTGTFCRKVDSLVSIRRNGSSVRLDISHEHPVYQGDDIFKNAGDIKGSDDVAEPKLIGTNDVSHIYLSDYGPILGLKGRRGTRYRLTPDKSYYVNTLYPHLIDLVNESIEYGSRHRLGISSYELGVLRGLKRRKTRIKYVRNKVNVDNSFMKLVGYYLAEGWSGDGGIKFAFHRDEVSYHEEVKNLIEEVFGVPGVIAHSKRYNATEVRSEGRSSILGDVFYNLFGQYSIYKDIPEWILCLPSCKLVNLIEGFIKGDGHGFKHSPYQSIGCSTSSLNMAAKLYYIFRKCGFEPRVRIGYPMMGPKDNRHRSINPAYGFSFDVDTSYALAQKFGLDIRKPINGSVEWNMSNNNETVFKVLEVNRFDSNSWVYNLEVATDNSYTIPFFGAVHNCFAAGKHVVYGNLYEQSLSDIWNTSEARKRLITRMELIHSIGTMPCSKCYMRSPVLLHQMMLMQRFKSG